MKRYIIELLHQLVFILIRRVSLEVWKKLEQDYGIDDDGHPIAVVSFPT
jgi:hypothetical protein